MKVLFAAALLVLSAQLVAAETSDGSTVHDNDKSDIMQLKKEMEELKRSSAQKIEKLEKLFNNLTQHRNVAGGGAVYTRWGRTVCPSDATLVYRGFMVSGYYSALYSGMSSSYLCLLYPPQWATYNDILNARAELHAVQYACTEPYCPFSLENFGGQSINMQVAPCAVCQAPVDRPNQVMIPAMRECPAGWTTEFNGYIVTNTYAQNSQSKEAVCVDEAPEVMPHSLTSFSGGIAYVAEVDCGGLPCSTYPTGREVTCAVCTN